MKPQLHPLALAATLVLHALPATAAEPENLSPVQVTATHNSTKNSQSCPPMRGG